MAKTFLGRYRDIVKLIRLCSKIVGCDITASDFRMGFLTWFVVVCINLFFLFTIYTIYVGIVVEGEWTLVLQTLCMATSGAQGYSKLLSAVSSKHILAFLLDDLASIYEQYEKKHHHYKVCLNKSINIVTKISRSIAIMYLVVTAAIALVPLYLRIFYNRKELVALFLVPGIDPNSDMGYIYLNCIHICLLMFGAFGNFSGDMYFITLISHMPLLTDILKCKINDLNCAVEDQPNNGEKSMELLKEIFEWHQRYLRFIALIKDVYFWVILVQVITIASGIACTLVCLLLGTWPAGALYLIYLFIMLYIYCGLGTLVEISNDGFTSSCYNDTMWYKYSVREQKMLQLMLCMSQNTTGLTVGAVLPLSVSTGLQVTKTIYTFTMMLINFLD